MFRFVAALSLGCALAGCAQIPKQAVELSATVGRDVAVVHQAHRHLAQLLFWRMRRDVDRFVDDIYGPAQLNAMMERQREMTNSDQPEDQNQSVILALQAGFKAGASAKAQQDGLDGMEYMLLALRHDVESKRAELRAPLAAQEAEVLGSIDRAYYQIHYANSIVTGHLSSVRDVHDAQGEALKAIGIDRDLRSEVGDKLAQASDQIAKIVDTAERADEAIGKAEDQVKKIKEVIDGLTHETEETK